MEKNKTVKVTVPTQSEWSNVLVLLILLPLCSPLFFTGSLRPLFSSSPVDSITLNFHHIISLAAIVLNSIVPLLQTIPMETLFLVLGLHLVILEGVVRLSAVGLLYLGAGKGLLLARFLIEALPITLKWTIFMRVIINSTAYEAFSNSPLSQNIAMLSLVPLFFLPLGGKDLISRYTQSLKLIPECYIYQYYGIILILFSLWYPWSSRTSKSRVSSSRFSIPSITTLNLYLSLILLLLLTSFTTNHCPTSSLRPSFLPILSLNGLTTKLLTKKGDSIQPTAKILESKLGVTGWISVGEQEARGQVFRYLRAEHSLLGGLWVGPSKAAIVERLKAEGASPFTPIDENEIVGTAETIYSTFILQEVVRLAKPLTSNQEHALIIGLGAGLSARALYSHAINVTVVEIDPVVFEFAARYFGVPSRLPGLDFQIEDARMFLARTRSIGYDFIIHDVFTGGTVPSTLFTRECWIDTKASLNPEGGILAVNFAGNIKSHASNVVLATILETFPSCRAFEDGPPSSDYRNIIILCSAGRSPIRFRNPVEGDYLPYPSPAIRKRVLETFRDFEIDLSQFKTGEILLDSTVKVLDDAQKQGAIEHWYMMKETLPDSTWSSY